MSASRFVFACALAYWFSMLHVQATARPITEDAASASADNFILVFKNHIKTAADVNAALSSLSPGQGDVQAAAAAGKAPTFKLLKLLTTSPGGSSGRPRAAASAAAGGRATAGSQQIPQAALLQMGAAEAELARLSPDVAAIFPDLVVTAVTAAEAQPVAAAASEAAAANQDAQAGLEGESVQASSSLQQVVTSPPACTPAPRKGFVYPPVAYCPDAPMFSVAGPSCPRQMVAAGETVPEGLETIEALRGGASLPNPIARGMQPVVVAVMGTGVDRTHPQLRYVGGQNLGVESTDKFSNDDDPGVDNNGLGTHVAGTITAINDGSTNGVVGVSPGTAVFSLKVLDGAGTGKLSSMLQAFDWLAAGNNAVGFQVLVVQGVVTYPPHFFAWDMIKQTFCGLVGQLEAAGVLVVVPAGNQQQSIEWSLPASCPTTLVVSSIGPATGDDRLPFPVSFSSFVSSSANKTEFGRIVAAPGYAVLSILPRTSSWGVATHVLSGTSSAAAFVAGVAANCISCRGCSRRAPPSVWRAAIVAAAEERAKRYSPRYGYATDPLEKPSGNDGRYYGWLVWSKW